MNRPRFAIYFAPERGSTLDRFGSAWLGRSCYTNGYVAPLSLAPHIDELRKRHLADPFRYGFHATLKPPFHLARNTAVKQLTDALREFAKEKTPFLAPPLCVREIGGFIALTLSTPSPLVARLADECVSHFDAFRAPPSENETTRRKAAGLSPRQEALLALWGYPYVMEEFRFHMTLTGKIADENARGELLAALNELWRDLPEQPLNMDAIALFCQESQGQPFYVLDRFLLGRAA